MVPYAGSEGDVIKDIRNGKRPPRPRDSNQNRWLQDPIWDAISTCWKNEPANRYQLSVVHEVFSTPSAQDAQSVKSGKSGDSRLRNSANFTISERFQAPKQGCSGAQAFSRGLPLSFSFYEIRSQRLRSLLMTWTR